MSDHSAPDATDAAVAIINEIGESFPTIHIVESDAAFNQINSLAQKPHVEKKISELFDTKTEVGRLALVMAQHLGDKKLHKEWKKLANVGTVSDRVKMVAKRLHRTDYMVYKDYDSESRALYYMDYNTKSSSIESSMVEDRDESNQHWLVLKDLFTDPTQHAFMHHLALHFRNPLTQAEIAEAVGCDSNSLALSRKLPWLNIPLADTNYKLIQVPSTDSRNYSYALDYKSQNRDTTSKKRAIRPLNPMPSKKTRNSKSEESAKEVPLMHWDEKKVEEELLQEFPYLRDNEDFINSLRQRRVKGIDLMLDIIRSSDMLGVLLGLDEIPGISGSRYTIMCDRIYSRVQVWKKEGL